MKYSQIRAVCYSLLLFQALSCSDADDSEIADESELAQDITSYKFTFDGRQYEIVANNMSWENAAIYAVEKGGSLAHIESFKEQNAIFKELIENSSIDFSKSIAEESGSAKIWLGGSDKDEEGKWIWDGNNDGSGAQFFQGDFFEGDVVNNSYANWGSKREPDNFGFDGQHALAMGMTDWIFGSAGQWNDLRSSNLLYFLIEY